MKNLNINDVLSIRPVLLETKVCKHCRRKTLNVYEDGMETCGYCMTWTYPIKNK